MNPPTIASIDTPTPPEFYETMLKESIDHFLTEFRRGGSNLSAFGSIFFRLIQTMADPPLEIIWFYSAVTFHTSHSTLQNTSNKVKIAKDLMQLLVSCSNPCNRVKKVAVLAPVVYELYNLVAVSDFSKRELGLSREIEDLVEGIISYISICYNNDLEDPENGLDSDNLMGCFDDLIRVWTVDRVGDNSRLFFPLLSDELRRGFDVRSGCVMGYLAGVVTIEGFLLRLCLKFGFGVAREDLQKDMLNWAVQIIKGFRNCYFLDMLLRMLLEPSLPVTTLLSVGDEVLLRKVLYDVVLLGEYSYLNSPRSTHLPGSHLKNLALIWLFVADNAIQFVRENGELAKSICYIDAFSESHLPNQLIKWVTNQNSVGEKLRPNISTPKALIKWLLILEDQGVRVFDQNVSKFHAKTIICKSKVEYELPAFKPDGKNQIEKTLFYIGEEGRGEDKVGGDYEMVDELDDAFSAAVCRGDLTATNGRRKREEMIMDERVTRIKLVKYDFHGNPVGENKFLPFSDDDGLSSGSEVENSVHGFITGSEMENTASDDDMEDMG